MLTGGSAEVLSGRGVVRRGRSMRWTTTAVVGEEGRRRRLEALRLNLALAYGAEEDGGAPRHPPERRGGLWPRAR